MFRLHTYEGVMELFIEPVCIKAGSFFFFFSHFYEYFPASGQAVVTGADPVLAFNFYRA